MYNSIVCGSCGAPLEVDEKAAVLGFAKCAHCGGTTQLPRPVGAEGAAARNFVLGLDEMEIIPEELETAVERPLNTMIELTQQPGEYFRLTRPLKLYGSNGDTIGCIGGMFGIGLGAIGGGLGGILVGFNLNPYLSFGISGALGVIVFIVGTWHIVRQNKKTNQYFESIEGRGGIDARDGKISIYDPAANKDAKPLVFRWGEIDLEFDKSSPKPGFEHYRSLFISSYIGRVPELANFFSKFTAAELRWTLTEWRRFREPLRVK